MIVADYLQHRGCSTENSRMKKEGSDSASTYRKKTAQIKGCEKCGLGDLSNDGTIDYVDLAAQVEDWLTNASQQPGDLNREGIVNMADFALLAQGWLQMTDWAE